ncbi:MAG: hypothetical protein ABDH20_09865 [Thermus sp.]
MSLHTDGAWSEGQVRRWGLEVPKEAVRVEGYLGLTAYARPLPVAFWVLPGLRLLPLTALRHLAGVAELRLRLRVPPDPGIWRVSFRQVHPIDEPDAVWLTPSGPVAVEYDVVSYSRRKVQAKARLFGALFVGQVWGAPVPARVATLRRLCPPETEVLEAPWN